MPDPVDEWTLNEGYPEGEVDPPSVLRFWFPQGELDATSLKRTNERWFHFDAETDQTIKDTFGEAVSRALNGDLDDWAEETEGRLALILLLDQFTRNIYRGSAEAFCGDERALDLCLEGLRRNQDEALDPLSRIFFYMPLQHSESIEHQELAVDLFQRLAESADEIVADFLNNSADFAILHRDIIARFGRFPHRNRVLGRNNTDAEDAYLAADAPKFGQ